MQMLSDVRVRVFFKRDCARKIQVEYHLPFIIQEASLEVFGGLEVKINRFSKTVRGAKDHFVLTDESSLLISGVIGESRLQVTFWKDDLENGRRFVEHCLGILSP